VVVAVLFSEWVELSWWSLAILVAAAIVVGQLLRLREHLLEVPISAMLVLAVGGSGVKAEARIVETLIGAAVGVLYNVLLPGPVQSRTAGEAVERMAEDIARLLRRIGDELGDRVTADRADDWLEEARSVSRRVTRVDRTLTEAEESRRLNVRALGTPDPGPALRSGMYALEHSAVALRSLCRSVLDRVRGAGENSYSPEVREVFAVLLHDLAEAVAAFGRLLREEAEGEAATQAQQLAQAIEAVGEARVRLTELLLIDRQEHEDWELHADLLTSVQRVLREIDVEERVRQQEKARRRLQTRPPAVQAVDRLRTTSRQIVRPSSGRWRRPSKRPH